MCAELVRLCAFCAQYVQLLTLPPSPSLTQSHTHIHSLSLVLVAVMKSKVLKTKTSHAHSLILSHCISHSIFHAASQAACLSGWAAYMGVNEAGLVVLWQYIDDTSRNFDSGVPTVVLIRVRRAHEGL